VHIHSLRHPQYCWLPFLVSSVQRSSPSGKKGNTDTPRFYLLECKSECVNHASHWLFLGSLLNSIPLCISFLSTLIPTTVTSCPHSFPQQLLPVHALSHGTNCWHSRSAGVCHGSIAWLHRTHIRPIWRQVMVAGLPTATLCSLHVWRCLNQLGAD
jgi:hypothetical protein